MEKSEADQLIAQLYRQLVEQQHALQQQFDLGERLGGFAVAIEELRQVLKPVAELRVESAEFREALGRIEKHLQFIDSRLDEVREQVGVNRQWQTQHDRDCTTRNELKKTDRRGLWDLVKVVATAAVTAFLTWLGVKHG